jgi:hypothetical protein
MSYKLTYSTMFDPPPEMHTRFEAALREVRERLGEQHALHINGEDALTATLRDKRSPIDRDWLLGSFAQAGDEDVDRAMRAAQDAFPRWRATPAKERIALLRRVAQLIEERVYHIGAALTLEVGKNRMEALGEVQETVDFFNVYCDDFLKQECFDRALPNDPLPNTVSRNRSVMKPYGVWVVINPFNFPFALAGGPVAAALVTGNTVVLKGASDTPWARTAPGDCGRHVHRIVRRRHAHRAHARARPISKTVHCGNGRQERMRSNGKRGSGTRLDGRHAQRIRHGRAEVLGAVALVRGERSRGCVHREGQRETLRAAHWRSDARGALARTCRERERASQVRELHRAPALRRRRHTRRRRSAG